MTTQGNNYYGSYRLSPQGAAREDSIPRFRHSTSPELSSSFFFARRPLPFDREIHLLFHHPILHALASLQQIAIALLPNISADPLPAALFEVTNDEHLSMYVAALGRSIVALHELSNNKRMHKEVERGEGLVEKPAAAGGAVKKEGKEGGGGAK
jgi:hypothetical protein